MKTSFYVKTDHCLLLDVLAWDRLRGARTWPFTAGPPFADVSVSGEMELCPGAPTGLAFGKTVTVCTRAGFRLIGGFWGRGGEAWRWETGSFGAGLRLPGRGYGVPHRLCPTAGVRSRPGARGLANKNRPMPKWAEPRVA